jgi:hypothetical protein
MVEIIEYPNGVCPKHGPKLSVNGQARCLKCEADADRATRPPRPVVTIEDPGHDAMAKIVPGGKPTTSVPTTATPNAPAKGVNPIPTRLEAIRDAIYQLPMPKSLKQYKRFLKIQELITQAVEEDNAKAD